MTVNIFRPSAEWGKGYLSMLRRIFSEVYYVVVTPEQFVLTLCKDAVNFRWPEIAKRATLLDARTSLGAAAFVAGLRRS